MVLVLSLLTFKLAGTKALKGNAEDGAGKEAVVDDFKDFWKWLDLAGAGLPNQGRANSKRAKRTGIKLQDLSGTGEVVYEGRRGRVIRHISDPFGALDLLELGFGDSHVRLHGYFGSDDEFMKVDRKRLG
jgi:hypothetical protein